MPHNTGFTTLDALPPSVGDAQVAAVLLRDLAAELAAGPAGAHSALTLRGVALTDDDAHFRVVDPGAASATAVTARAALQAPELSTGADPDSRTDVYAAAGVALTRYLGSAPVAALATSRGASTSLRLAAVRQAHRVVPARLGAMPAPFRTVFAQAMAKEPHLRPTAARLVTLLDAAFAAAGPGSEADARARVHRLVVLAQAFVPAPAAALPVPVDLEPLRLPAITLPAFSRPRGAARAALIGAVALVAVGGVITAAVLGVGGGVANRTPQADSTGKVETSATPTASPSPAVASSSAAPVAPVAPPATSAAAGGGGSGSGGSGSGGSGSRDGSSAGGSSGNGSSGSGSSYGGSRSSAPKAPYVPPPAPTADPPPATDTTPPPPPPVDTPPPTDTPTESPSPTDPPTSPSPTPTDTATSTATPTDPGTDPTVG